jgi:hypothetical protein
MTSYEIKSFHSVGDLRFGMSRSQVHGELGAPIRSKADRFSSELTDFWNESGLQLAFSGPDGELLEVSLYPNLPLVRLGSLSLYEGLPKEVYGALCEADGAPRSTVGVTVFLRLGLAVTGFLNDDTDDMSVTAFARGRWDANDPDLLPLKKPWS